jgi:hypothetical protein
MLLTIYRAKLGTDGGPVVWLLTGIIVSIAFVGLHWGTDADPTLAPINLKQRGTRWLLPLFLGIVIAYLFYTKLQLFPDEGSDVIPSLKLFCQRLLTGEYPYTPMQVFDYTLQPTYLPAMWLPFLLAELLGFDYRLIPIFVYFGIAILVWGWSVVASTSGWLSVSIKSALLFIPLLLMMDEIRMVVFSNTVELLPVSFYLVLLFGIYRMNTNIIALGLVLCLLSRYSLVLWLPLAVLVFYMEKGWKESLKVSLMVIAGILLLYVIPFLSKDWSIFSDGMKYYSQSVYSEWRPHHWQAADEVPYHLNQGIGFARAFYIQDHLPVEQRVKLIQRVHLIVSLLSVLIGLLAYLWLRKKKGFNAGAFLIASLYFYLLWFYSFIQVPYAYLMLLPYILLFYMMLVSVDKMSFYNR